MKHAFLIIAHNEPYILQVLLDKLRGIPGDIFVHIDKKVRGEAFDRLRNVIGGKMLQTRIDVRWGDFSQVECELALFKEAAQGHYDYYHLLSGVDLPIKPAQYIADFFEKHKGLEFFRIADDDENRRIIFRNTNYWYLFTRFSRSGIGRILQKLFIPRMMMNLQKLLKLSRCSKDGWTLYKGDQWLSITHDAVECILGHEEYIRGRFKFTCCPDEIYKQTVLMNSGFAERVYVPIDTENAALRAIDWERGRPYTWRMNDVKELLASGNLFARKFSTSIDKKIIDYFKENI